MDLEKAEWSVENRVGKGGVAGGNEQSIGGPKLVGPTQQAIHPPRWSYGWERNKKGQFEGENRVSWNRVSKAELRDRATQIRVQVRAELRVGTGLVSRRG